MTVKNRWFKSMESMKSTPQYRGLLADREVLPSINHFPIQVVSGPQKPNQ